jgi:tetratricopeptide (TPR) repeat protein
LGILIFAGYATRLVMADRALAVTWQRVVEGDIEGASDAYRSVEAWDRWGATSDLSYSRAMQQAATATPIFSARLAARRQAFNAGVRAVRSAEDRANAWYNLALLLAERNDATGAERALRNAIAWAPHWFKPHWALARLLDLSGRGGEAIEEARIAFECDGGRDPEVGETWKQLTQARDSR